MDRDHPRYSMNDAKLQEHRISVSRRCPSCGHELDCMPDMMGLPVGVKFDPTDQELIEHLETKVMDGGSRAHPLIDDFIPTIQGEDGICYTHPEKLPGVTRNGQSKHFFHRSSKAYTTGTRKRRKIQAESDQPNSKNCAETRWHKTGKTRALMVDGRQKGCKKILVLYTSFGKHRKPEKTNWVMHQYNLGGLDDEKEGELIVSKVFYQTQTRHGVAGTAATLDERARDGNMEEETAGSTQIGIIGAYALAAAAAATVEEQRQQLKQDDEQFSYAAPKKRLHELQVAAEHEVAVDQAEEQHRHHHRPSQLHVSPNLQAMPLPGTNALASQPPSLMSAIHPASVNLNNKLPNSTTLPNGNLQRPPARHCQETQWRYKTSPPEKQDQHG